MDAAIEMEKLWSETPPAEGCFDPGALAGLPDAARRYLGHALEPGVPLATAVRLRMHGSIRIGRWRSFRAEQVLAWDRGFVWKASVSFFGLPVRGHDALVEGAGAMHWKLLGLLPVERASGPDVTRSAAGRMAAECVWLPPALAARAGKWEAQDGQDLRARVPAGGRTFELDLGLAPDGALRTLGLERWGNPGGGAFRAASFGGVVEEEACFHGCTLPSRLLVGWHWGTDRFEDEGAFFRVTVDEAEFR